MDEFLKKLRRNNTVAVVLMILAGVALLLKPENLFFFIGVVTGAVLCVAGVVVIIRYFLEKDVDFSRRYNLLIGLVLLTMGICLIVYNQFINEIISRLFGVVVLFHAIVDLQQAFNMKKYGYKRWWIALIIALVALAAGVVFICIPGAGENVIGRVIGGVMIYDAVTDLWINYKINKLIR